MPSLYTKIFILLSVAIIVNISFILLSYQFIENAALNEGSGILISMKYDRSEEIDDNYNVEPVIGISADTTEGAKEGQNNNINNDNNNSNVWLTGIILDTTKIREQVWKVIVQLNCQYNIGIHIIAKLNVERGLKGRDALYNSFEYSHDNCAPFIIFDQESDQLLAKSVEVLDNRIDRISLLRDYQRNLLRKEVFPSDIVRNNGVVILADLDLSEFPSVELIVHQITSIKEKSYPHDAICAIGMTLHFESFGKENNIGEKRRPLPFYYDTYATVFLPDTFSHPLSRRLIPHFYHGEDPQLVRSNDQVHGNFTQADIWKYFVEKGRENSSNGNVPVRSCFGGLAIYRSKIYFQEGCQYKLDEAIVDRVGTVDDTTILRYASNGEKRPCEHVVFHDCLVREDPRFAIAVNPRLVTSWKRDKK